MFTALCALGAEKILGNELKLLGYKLQGNAPGRVRFVGDELALYRTNYCLRTADRVFLCLAHYKAENFDDLFDICFDIPWNLYLKKDSRVVVDKVRIYKSKLNSEHSIQKIIQKSIYKKLGEVWNMSVFPESGETANIRIYIEENVVSVLLDTSGDPLHKRGYRKDGGEAPLRETLAAVLLQEFMWRRKIPLHDPFCGSGTIPIEATLYAYNVAPGLGRHFAYENLAIYDSQKAQQVQLEEVAKIRTDVQCKITGSDINPAAVDLARVNAEHACVTAGRALHLIGSDVHLERPDFIVSDYTELRAPYPDGLLLCNPPYGERLGDIPEAENLYREMASLFADFEGWNMGFITSREQFESCIGKKADVSKKLKAGNFDTTLYMYRANVQNNSKGNL